MVGVEHRANNPISEKKHVLRNLMISLGWKEWRRIVEEPKAHPGL